MVMHDRHARLIGSVKRAQCFIDLNWWGRGKSQPIRGRWIGLVAISLRIHISHLKSNGNQSNLRQCWQFLRQYWPQSMKPIRIFLPHLHVERDIVTPNHITTLARSTLHSTSSVNRLPAQLLARDRYLIYIFSRHLRCSLCRRALCMCWSAEHRALACHGKLSTKLFIHSQPLWPHVCVCVCLNGFLGWLSMYQAVSSVLTAWLGFFSRARSLVDQFHLRRAVWM